MQTDPGSHSPCQLRGACWTAENTEQNPRQRFPPHHCHHDGVVAGPALEELLRQRWAALRAICIRGCGLIVQHAPPGSGSCCSGAAAPSPGLRSRLSSCCVLRRLPFRCKAAPQDGGQGCQQEAEAARRHIRGWCPEMGLICRL